MKRQMLLILEVNFFLKFELIFLLTPCSSSGNYIIWSYAIEVLQKWKICNRLPWKSYSEGTKKVIQYLRNEKNSKQQQILSKNLGTSLGFLIGKISLICECPTSLISKHFPLSLLLGVSTFQTLKIIRVSIFIVQAKHFRSSNDQMLFILLLLTFFKAITAITLILFPRRPKRLKPHTYEIVNYIYYFTVFTKYLRDQIE